MNVTAFRGVNEIEEKVKMAEDKALSDRLGRFKGAAFLADF